MSGRSTYLPVFLVAMLLVAGCHLPWKKKINWSVTLDRTDKNPYGAYLAFESLKRYFPMARTEALSRGFRFSSLAPSMTADDGSPALLVSVGLDFYVSEEEMDNLLAFVKQGNEVLICARSLDDKLERRLGGRISDNGWEETGLRTGYDGSDNAAILSIPPDGNKYGYQGRSVRAYFSFGKKEQGIAREPEVAVETLGFVKDRPDFVRLRLGHGHITFHAAPLVMSNYFLLQGRNRLYLDAIWNSLPAGISRVYWNNYFKRTADTSDLGVLFRYPATRWAFILALVALSVYVLFETKRRQRIVPVIAPPENSSVSFVETVGRLYYNKGDHTNLAEKMIQHFLEWVRTHYYMSTHNPDTQFARQLALKSGLPENVTLSLVELINEVQGKKRLMDEADLYHLNNTIQQFYKNHSK